MALTRRSLLRNAGSLSALPVVSAMLAGTAEATSKPRASTTAPSPQSAYILFEGPWLFFPDGTAMTAVTLGDQSPIGAMHVCTAGLGQAGVVTINPLPNQAQATTVPSPANWVATAPKFDTMGQSFTKAWNVPFQYDAFVWFDTGATRNALPDDRAVNVPIPTTIYVAGRLHGSKLSTPNGVKTSTPTGYDPRPYVTTILEYAHIGPQGITLSAPGTLSAPVVIHAGNHLIFRVAHEAHAEAPVAMQMDHIQQTYTELTRRVQSHMTPGTLTLTDVLFVPGDHIDGFTLKELGLDPGVQPKGGVYANCAGGGGPVGDCC